MHSHRTSLHAAACEVATKAQCHANLCGCNLLLVSLWLLHASIPRFAHQFVLFGHQRRNFSTFDAHRFASALLTTNELRVSESADEGNMEQRMRAQKWGLEATAHISPQPSSSHNFALGATQAR